MTTATAAAAGELLEIDVQKIDPSPFQPRQHFDDDELAALANSMQAEEGLINRPIVRPRPDGRWELLAGERRWRAAKKAGWKKIPVTVRDVGDERALRIIGAEQLLNVKWNPVEFSRYLANLCSPRPDGAGLTLAAAAAMFGKSESWASRYKMLLEFPDEWQQRVVKGELKISFLNAITTFRQQPDTLAAIDADREANSWAWMTLDQWKQNARRLAEEGTLTVSGATPRRPRSIVARPKSTRKARRLLTRPEVDRLLEAISERTRPAFRLMYATGLTAGQLCALTLGDIDLDGGIAHVKPQGRRGAKLEHALPEDAIDEMRPLLEPLESETAPLFTFQRPAMHTLFSTAAEKAGLAADDIDLDSLRLARQPAAADAESAGTDSAPDLAEPPEAAADDRETPEAAAAAAGRPLGGGMLPREAAVIVEASGCLQEARNQLSAAAALLSHHGDLRNQCWALYEQVSSLAADLRRRPAVSHAARS